MPAPITHIVLTDKIFDKYFADKDRREFFIGTSFPDIRYYDNLDRNKTHQGGLSLEEMAKESSFLAGLHFHALVDEKWEQFHQSLREHPFYAEPYHVLGTALKFFQDELLYDRFSNWKQAAEYFSVIIEEEKKFEIKEKDIAKWHEFLRGYFINGPNDQTRKFVLMGSNFHSDFADQINLFIKQMKEDEQVIAAANNFYDKFESLF